jgi:hypothetical protein
MSRTILLVLLFLTACASVTTSFPDATPVEPGTTNPEFDPTPALLDPGSDPTPAFLEIESPPTRAELEFSTDFSRHIAPYSEILTGGPPKDGIPSIDNPRYVSVQEADAWLAPVEPIILVEFGKEARAYPIQILIWHEIVNDTLGDLPILVSFCPLCNTAIAFERTYNGLELDFGTTGRLRYSNLIMYDRQTESWWQQATGEAIAGEFTGGTLTFHPAAMISWKSYRDNFPDGTVLSRDTGFIKPYGTNPYAGYDDINTPPFLYAGPQTPSQLQPTARVLTVDLNGEAVAYTYDILKEQVVVNDLVGGEPLVVIWTDGTASALDNAVIANGRDVGAAVAYSRQLGDRLLTFAIQDGLLTDLETGSIWNILGQAVGGPIAGESLSQIVSVNHFWFSWAVFQPDTRIYTVQ